MAKAMGISHTSVQRIWRDAGLKPHLDEHWPVADLVSSYKHGLPANDLD